MDELAEVKARNPLGRFRDGKFVVTEEDIRKARSKHDQELAVEFDNVLLGAGSEAVFAAEDVNFQAVVALAQGAGAVIIASREFWTYGHYASAGLAGAIVGAVKAAGTASKTSQRVDWAPIQPGSIGWEEDGEATLTVEGSQWKLTFCTVEQCCLRAWQATSFEEFRHSAGRVRGVSGPLLALLVYGVAKGSDPRHFLDWRPPYDSLTSEVAKRLANPAEWRRVCALADDSSNFLLYKHFCRNLARLSVPGACEAAQALAQKLNSRNRDQCAIMASIGVAVAAVGCILFIPFGIGPWWGWGLLVVGLLLVGASVYGLFRNADKITSVPNGIFLHGVGRADYADLAR